MNKKVIIGGVVFVVLVFALGVFLNMRKVSVQQPEGTPEPAVGGQSFPETEDESFAIDTSSWETYQNQDLGFELKLPTDWAVLEENHRYDNGVRGFSFGSQDCQRSDDLMGSCGKFVRVEVYESPEEGDLIWPAEDYEYEGNIPSLDFSFGTSGVSSYQVFAWQQSWDVYQYTENGIRYKLAIKTSNQEAEPEVERAVLRSFGLSTFDN